jgi:hypothetical protein
VTFHDLHDAFRLLERQAPTTIPLPMDRKRHAALKRWAAPVAAAAAVLALAVAAMSFTQASTGKSSAAPSGTGVATTAKPTLLSFDFSVSPVPGFDITLSQVSPGLQEALIAVRGLSPQPTGTVSVYAAGKFKEAATVQTGQPTTVSEHRGFFTKLSTLPSNTDLNAPKLYSVAWLYAPNSWAVVQINYGTLKTYTPARIEAAELQVANAVRMGTRSALKVPFTIGYLPPGIYPVSADQATDPEGGAIGLGDGRPMAGTTPFSTALTIWVDNVQDPNHVFCPAGDKRMTRFTLNGFVGCVQRNQLTGKTGVLSIQLARGYLEITLGQAQQGVYSDAQLKRVAESIVPADSMTDRRTWIDATVSVP